MSSSTDKNIFNVLKSAVHVLIENKKILLPFTLIVFIQFIVLEILCFAPQFPLNQFFAPLIRKLWSEAFLHYPNYYLLLPKLFQYSQFALYIFLNAFLIGIAIAAIKSINDGKSVVYKKIVRENMDRYLHVCILASLIFIIIMCTVKGYGFLIERAEKIQSTSGSFYLIKRIVIDGASYFNLIISAFVTTIFAYVLPIIIIERKKVSSAIIQSFKISKGNFWDTFLIVLIPTLLFAPILLLRSSIPPLPAIPEAKLFILGLSVIAATIIDAVIYTALTSVYLLKKETA